MYIEVVFAVIVLFSFLIIYIGFLDRNAALQDQVEELELVNTSWVQTDEEKVLSYNQEFANREKEWEKNQQEWIAENQRLLNLLQEYSEAEKVWLANKAEWQAINNEWVKAEQEWLAEKQRLITVIEQWKVVAEGWQAKYEGRY